MTQANDKHMFSRALGSGDVRVKDGESLTSEEFQQELERLAVVTIEAGFAYSVYLTAILYDHKIQFISGGPKLYVH